MNEPSAPPKAPGKSVPVTGESSAADGAPAVETQPQVPPPATPQAPGPPVLPAPMQPPRPRDDWFSLIMGFSETGGRAGVHQWTTLHPPAVDGGPCMLESRANGERYAVGNFATPSLAELRANGQPAIADLQGTGRLRVVNEVGDVTSKYNVKENRFAVFQVASQFNCLEFVNPRCKPEDGVAGYAYDHTQGPASAIACGPATIVRNYHVPLDGNGNIVPAGSPTVVQEGQTEMLQVDTLRDLGEKLGNSPSGTAWNMVGGYTLADARQLSMLNKVLRPLRKASDKAKLDQVRGLLRVGIQNDVQVTADDWGQTLLRDPEQIVTQVFGSACAVAYNTRSAEADWELFATLILEASYEATLWAALINAHRHGGQAGSRRVFLTCLGGGVFGNSMEWIVNAIHQALTKFKDCPLDVRIVSLTRACEGLEDLAREYRG